MKEIPLTQGQVALVDDADYDELSKYKWQAHWNKNSQTYYARRCVRTEDNKKQPIQMHRQILGLTNESILVDHKDHIGTNNWRKNLRCATDRQNLHNMRKRSNCSSQYKGVSWYKSRSRWLAQIIVPTAFGRGKKKNLGYFKDEIEAAKAYDTAAKKYFGEFASLNFK